MKKSRWAAIAATMLVSGAAQAAVDRIEITERVPFAPGVKFGEAGEYEKLRGIAYFSLNPKAAANLPIVDLKRAPRDKRGMVRFSSEFVLLRPVSGKTGTLVYDVNTRGNIVVLGQLNGKA
ncbi:MAG TPA: hypothetical protein VGD52_18510, partial [Pseudoduganella sp.]